MMKKRLLSLFLALCLCAALLPAAVLAEEPSAGETVYISLTQADVDKLETKSLDYSQYPADTTIHLTLAEDIVMPEGVCLSVSKVNNSGGGSDGDDDKKAGILILDLNGHTLHGDLSIAERVCVLGNGIVTGETGGISTAHIEGGTFLGAVGIFNYGFFLTGGIFAGGLHVGKGSGMHSVYLPTIYGGSFYGTLENAEKTRGGHIYGGTFYGDILDIAAEKISVRGPVVTYMDGEAVYAKQVVLESEIEESKAKLMTDAAKKELNANVRRAIMPVEPSRPGYRLTGWFTEDGELWDFDSPVTENMTLYAGWTADPDYPLASILPAIKKGMDFADVSAADWFCDDVKYVYESGLMTGTSDTAFSPDAPVTRGMVLTILARQDGIRTERYDPWYAAGCEWAVLHGVSDGTNPDAPVTREQLAAMLYRFAKLKGYDLTGGTLDAFADGAAASAYAREALGWAAAQTILTGANGRLDPQGTATRAQLAAILHRFLTK